MFAAKTRFTPAGPTNSTSGTPSAFRTPIDAGSRWARHHCSRCSLKKPMYDVRDAFSTGGGHVETSHRQANLWLPAGRCLSVNDGQGQHRSAGLTTGIQRRRAINRSTRFNGTVDVAQFREVLHLWLNSPCGTRAVRSSLFLNIGEYQAVFSRVTPQTFSRSSRAPVTEAVRLLAMWVRASSAAPGPSPEATSSRIWWCWLRSMVRGSSPEGSSRPRRR